MKAGKCSDVLEVKSGGTLTELLGNLHNRFTVLLIEQRLPVKSFSYRLPPL